MTIEDLISEFSARLTPVADFLGVDRESCHKYVREIALGGLVDRIKSQLEGVPQFSKAEIRGIESFHLYRTFLYVIVRWLKPETFLETGVLHGFSSAFILEAMKKNNKGRLVSIDLPHTNERFVSQGTHPLPEGYQPGWAIPDDLSIRHDLRLGDAVRLLPAYFLSEEPPDIFLHDSDHEYEHMMFELSVAFKNLASGGLIIVDNIEMNRAFHNFCKGVRVKSLIVASYPKGHQRCWLHGIIKIP